MSVELKILVILVPSGFKCSVPIKHQPNRGRGNISMGWTRKIRGPEMLTEPKLQWVCPVFFLTHTLSHCCYSDLKKNSKRSLKYDTALTIKGKTGEPKFKIKNICYQKVSTISTYSLGEDRYREIDIKMCVGIISVYITDIFYTCMHMYIIHTYPYLHIHVITCRVFNSFKSRGKASNNSIFQMVKRLE